MPLEYGDIISIPITIKENNTDKQIQIYNPVKETPQFTELLHIIHKWIVIKFDIHDMIPLVSKIMAVVNQTVSRPHSGEYKKKIVLSLLYCCVKASDLMLADKHMAYSIIANVAPSAIDTMVSIAKGDINVKKSLEVVEKGCLSIFDSTKTRQEKELSNEMVEHQSHLDNSPRE